MCYNKKKEQIMYITFSGFEGCGKSTLLDEIKSNSNYMVSKESARSLIDMKKKFLEDKNDLSYTALLTNLKTIEFTLNNNIKNVAFDRNIIDDLTYLKLYNGQNLDHFKLNNYLDDFCNTYNRKTLYDTVVLLQHPKDNSHILENILSDEDRIYGQDAEQYKQESEKWEKCFLDIYEDFPRIARKIKVIQAYPENKNILNDINKIINTKKYKKTF